MIKSIQVVPNTTTSKILFFNELNFEAMPDFRVIPLFGANGSGKSTLIKAIGEEPARLEREKEEERRRLAGEEGEIDISHFFHRRPARETGIRLNTDMHPMGVYSYKNGDDNFRDRTPRSMDESFSPFFLNSRWEANSLSEGQSIMYSAYDLFRGIANPELISCEDVDCLFLIDEFDSGLSLDNIDACMRLIKKALKQRNDIQVIFSFNNPRILHWFPDVLSMYDGKPHRLNNVDEMLAEIKANNKMLEKARGRRGRLKIFE